MNDCPEEVGTNTDQYALERGKVFFYFFWKPESDGTRYTHAIDIMQSYVIDDFTLKYLVSLWYKIHDLFTTQTKNKTRRTRKDS